MYQKQLTDEQKEILSKCKTYSDRLVYIQEYYPNLPGVTQRFMAKDAKPWEALGFIHNHQKVYRDKRLRNLKKKRKLVEEEANLVQRTERAIERSVKSMNRRKKSIESLLREKEQAIPWAQSKLKQLHEVETDPTPLTISEQMRTAKELYEVVDVLVGHQGDIEVKPVDGLDNNADKFFSNIMDKVNNVTNVRNVGNDNLDKQLISVESYADELKKSK